MMTADATAVGESATAFVNTAIANDPLVRRVPIMTFNPANFLNA